MEAILPSNGKSMCIKEWKNYDIHGSTEIQTLFQALVDTLWTWNNGFSLTEFLLPGYSVLWGHWVLQQFSVLIPWFGNLSFLQSLWLPCPLLKPPVCFWWMIKCWYPNHERVTWKHDIKLPSLFNYTKNKVWMTKPLGYILSISLPVPN